MYLFRQFCEFLWLAIFFQKSIVSRASVNGDLEKGPHLPQSFSTKVAIESGLYIGTWEHFSAGPTSIWRPWSDLRSKVGSRSQTRVARRTSDQPLRPDSSKWPLWRVWPEKCSGWRFWPESCSEPEIARIAKISTFRENSRFWWFLRFLDLSTFLTDSPSKCLSELMVWAHVHRAV